MFADHKAIKREAEAFRRVSAALKLERMRDEFAAAALSGVIAAGEHLTVEADCEAAYAYADAMMIARNAGRSETQSGSSNEEVRG